MPHQRHSQLQISCSQQTLHHSLVTSEDVTSPVPLHAVAAEPETGAATGHEFPPQQQPLDTTAEPGGSTTEVPDAGLAH